VQEDINISAGGHLLLHDMVAWLTKDSGIMILVDNLRETVALYIQIRVETANDIILASRNCVDEGREK